MLDYKAIYSLSKRLGRLKLQAIGKCEKRFTHAEFAVMLSIKSLSDGGENNITSSLIASEVEMPKPQVSRILNSIENAGVIERVNSKSDRREVYIILTKKGNKFISDEKVKHDEMIKYIYNAVGEDDFNNLIRIIQKIEKALEEKE